MTQRPVGPDGTELTPEEWDAVRRLRGERADEQPRATAEPLEPVAPVPPPAETAPPVTEAGVTEAGVAPVNEAPVNEAPVNEAPVTQVPVTAAPVSEAETAATSADAPSWGGPRTAHRRTDRTASPVALPALAALVVLAVVSVVLAALVGLRVSDRNDRDSASTAALAAATTGVASVLSYNYRSLDADFAKAEALLTPSFRKAYVSTTAKAVQPLAAKYKAVSTAQVSAAGVINASGSKATVLVFVSQQVTNTQLSAPRLDRSRIQVDLVHSHGRWLINKLTPL